MQCVHVITRLHILVETFNCATDRVSMLACLLAVKKKRKQAPATANLCSLTQKKN